MCVCLRIVVSNTILCCVFVLFFFVFFTLCCQFLWVVHFWLYVRYSLTFIEVQWNLCNMTPEFSDILWHPTKLNGPKVFLFTKIKPEYSYNLDNQTHFPDPLVFLIRQVLTTCTIRHISLVSWCFWLDKFHCTAIYYF